MLRLTPRSELTINVVIRGTLASGNMSRVLADGLPWRAEDRRARVLELLSRYRHGASEARVYECAGCHAAKSTTKWWQKVAVGERREL